MSIAKGVSAEVFSAREIARAAGVQVGDVQALIDAGQLPAVHGYVAAAHAVRAVRRLRAGTVTSRRDIFAPPAAAQRSPGAGLAASGALHAAMLGVLALVTTLSLASEAKAPMKMEPARLVFIATPGPGGGGGGGGLRQPAPPPKAEMRGVSRLRSPVPPPRRVAARKPEPKAPPPRPVVPVPQPQPKPVEPPPAPPKPAVTPQVVAPVVTASSDARDRAGVLAEAAAEADSQGPGSGGGVGTGQGTGIGEGTGSGIGPGSGGGTGGGPYRGGSGITAPSLLHEVRPEYTDDARRQGIEGDVVLEIVVRRDGSVGEVRVVSGLRGGLDRRAIDAVRQWKFSPARRNGAAIDLYVEVAVEFKLR